MEINIGELLSYKPDITPKRPAASGEKEEELEDDDPNDSYEKRAAKRRKKQRVEQQRRERERMAMLETEAAMSSRPANDDGLTEEQRNKIRELVDNAEDDGSKVLDETEMKKLILSFEKRVTKNQELRIKFPDDPQKFMMSEVELHDAIHALRSIATVPDLYPMMVGLNCIPSFIGLLTHENTDIIVEVIDLVQELTDIDTMQESEEGADSLIDALMDNQISANLVQCLDRLNEPIREESDGIHNCLSIFENLIEFKPQVCKEAAEVGLLPWLVKKLKVKVPFNNNKLFASEILSILLQNEPENRQKLGESGAIDSLLQQLAYYKRHDPGTPEEVEMMENLFDCLCSLLLFMPNRERFLKGEGLQLMNLMLREKKASRNGALKVLDHALIGVEGKDNCSKFIDILGLRTIFPLFMKTPKKHKRKGLTAEEHEEHVISILASLVKNSRGSQRQRLLAKFTESDHEKVERLMELHFKYLDKVTDSDRSIQRDKLDEDEAYLRRLDSGLFSLQLVDYVIIEVCSSGAETVEQRVGKILHSRNANKETIKDIIIEYADNLGDDGDEERDSEKQYLLNLAKKF